ncbi:MAG TPA: penicillin-binding transpeptidase domain-containing protein [Chlamydiales bacterium]|nr:penicillin-binding transpeptidase domain-containing protein [Chlamydiales bacterium]
MTTALKINRVLRLIFLAFLAIVLRVWHLGMVQREEKLLEAQKPQQRTILVRADRGTIYDRFHIPLALNRICYNAAVYYGQIAQIPTITWKSDGSGRQIKCYARKEYIRELSQVLAKTLQLDAERVEDLIHAKASLFPHVPFILKAGVTEEEHYRLKMLEKDWLGIHAEITSSRFYPQGKTGCGVIGTMGAISQREFSTIAQEISDLQAAVDSFDPLMEESQRLAELKEKAYAIDDLVGKTGIEAQYEEALRGFFGKKTFEVDQKGHFLREISGREAIAGKQVVLSISSELQQFAESLLSQDEKTRDGRSLGRDPSDNTRKVQKQPWIKGGAIVALDPKTGEILAFASHPRFDPNDFVPLANSLYREGKARQVNRWLENDRFIGSVWDGQELLTRERGRAFQEEPQMLTWDFYLDLILPKEGPLRTLFHRVDDVKGAIQMQEDYEAMLYFSSSHLPIPIDIQRRLDSMALPPQDKALAIDLYRTAIYAPAFSDPLIAQVGSMKISTYRTLCQAFQRLEGQVRQKAQEEFHRNEFQVWREAHQKEFLAEKRKSEKERKTYARPYIDYLDQKERELFADYWNVKRLYIVRLHIEDEPLIYNVCKSLEPVLIEEFLRTFRSFADLNRPLLGKYRNLRNHKKVQIEKDLAAAFYPMGGFGFSRSFAFQAPVPQGSIFKLVTAYEGLRQGKQLTLIDELSQQGVAYTPNRTLYPRFYKGGRLPRSAAAQIGKIDLLGAIEQTSNPYFSILAGDCFADPDDLSRAALLFGFGEKTGIDLPTEKRGKVPTDLKTNRTGLYSTAIGQHTLLTTPLQTAVMTAALANGGKLLKPRLVTEAIGLSPDRQPLGAFAASSYFAKDELAAIGIQFPLFTATQPREPLATAIEQPTEIKRTIPLEPRIRSLLLEGMDRVVWGTKGSARPSAIKGLLSNPLLMRDYLSLQHQMVGKTGTAELLCNLSIHPTSLPQVYKYIWFSGISFHDTHHSDPELVVVVFLRFGDAGKEAAPLAAQMITKWREIKKSHAL